MNRITATIRCRQSWWLKYYLIGVLAMAQFTAREPDAGRVSYWVGHGLKIEVH